MISVVLKSSSDAVLHTVGHAAKAQGHTLGQGLETLSCTGRLREWNARTAAYITNTVRSALLYHVRGEAMLSSCTLA